MNKAVRIDVGSLELDNQQGAIWSLPQGGDLDANVVHLTPGGEIGAHINTQVDVMVVVTNGSGRLIVEDHILELAPAVAVALPKGTRRSLHAGAQGLTYLSIHRSRGPLNVRSKRRD